MMIRILPNSISAYQLLRKPLKLKDDLDGATMPNGTIYQEENIKLTSFMASHIFQSTFL
ncbi:MAG: hypothetical protein RLZZ69_3591 [Cyanobacteriota bacterium]|jgi:hypothetical protein